MSDSLWPHGLWPTKLLCPWNFPNKNTGMVPFLTPRELPDQRIKPVSLTTPALAGGFFTTGTTWQTLSELWTEKIILVYEEMATHSSVLAWRIPGTGEPGGLLSMGSHWSNLAAAAAAAAAARGYKIYFGGDENALKLVSMMTAQLCEDTVVV